MTTVFRVKKMFLTRLWTMQNGVSLIALHCSLKCVALNTVFQSGWQMCHINIVLFIWCICCGTYMQRSVSEMTCLFFGNRESYIYFNKQVEIYTSHLVLLHINSCTKISCFWNKWLITETLVFVWNCVISNKQYSTEIKAWLSIKPFMSLSNTLWNESSYCCRMLCSKEPVIFLCMA